MGSAWDCSAWSIFYPAGNVAAWLAVDVVEIRSSYLDHRPAPENGIVVFGGVLVGVAM